MNSTDTPSSHERAHEPLHLGLGADVDAARRLVEDQQPRLGEQPAREQHLLLVAAAERADGLVRVGGPDVERLDPLRDELVLPRGARSAASSRGRACSARMMFSRTVSSSTSPSVRRFSGQKATASRDRRRAGCASRPARRRSGARPRPRGRRRTAGAPSSVRPEPSRPARPTTSPGATARSNGAIAPLRPDARCLEHGRRAVAAARPSWRLARAPRASGARGRASSRRARPAAARRSATRRRACRCAAR